MSDTIHIGREGWLGIGIEDSAGSGGETPKKYLPWTSCTLHNVVEVLDDEAAKGIRNRAWGSVAARTRGEGDVTVLMDAKNAPYLIFPALGTGVWSALVDRVYKHTFTPKTGNPPKTICLNFNDTIETRMYHYGVVNTLEITFSDGWAEMTAGLLSKAPENGSGSRSITTERVLAFKDASIQFGTNLTTAAAASTTPLSAFTLTINNNAEAQYCSGSSSPAQISIGQLEVGGNYTLFFEDTTERSAHELQTGRAMIITFTGKAIPSGVESDNEEIKIKIPQFHITDRGVDTSPSGFVTENPTFVADYNETDGTIIIEVTNTEDFYKGETGFSSSSSSSSSSCSSSFSSSCSSSSSSSSSTSA